MSETPSNETVVEAYAVACGRNDLAAMKRLRHPAWYVEWPQSGEVVRGHESFAAIAERYPGGPPTVELQHLLGSEDRWVVTPGNTVLRIAGSGDFWCGEWRMTYPDGQTYHVVDLIQLRDGLVYRERVYWAAPFDAPDWRRPYVEIAPNLSPSRADT